MHVVVDTNVVISRYLAPNSRPAEVLALWEQGVFDLVVSPEIMAEYDRVLREPKIRKVHGKSDGEIDDVVRRINEAAVRADPEQRITVIDADPDDDKFIECAVAGGAGYIVTGEKHLLALGSYQRIQIIPPAVFVKLFAPEDEETSREMSCDATPADTTKGES